MARKIQNIHDLTQLMTDALEDLAEDRRGPAYVCAVSRGAGTVLRAYALMLRHQGLHGSGKSIPELEARR